MDEIVILQDITKDYGRTRALDRVNLTVRRAEIHGLVGENGAGKSTLAKIISGDIDCNAGTYLFDGNRINNLSPWRARELGISIVHQWGDLALNLSVVDNIFLGNEEKRLGIVLDRPAMKRKAKEILDHLGVQLDPDLPARRLSPAHQQIVGIAKALSHKSSFLILDEGGVSLDREELEYLFQILRQLKAGGVTILYISHLLDNVLNLCDSITVLRNGKWVATVVARQTDVNELASLMVGREVRKTARDEQIVPKTRGSGIRVQSLSWQENGESYTFEVGVGEILGITGPAGSGKSELLRTIMGFQPAVGGSVHLAGKRIRNPSPRSMIREGVAFIPEDRFAEGLFLPHSIEQNISLPNLWKSSRLLLKKSRLNRQAEDISAVVSLKKDTVLDPMTSLSGGNQQKVVIGKWLRFGYQYFLFDEPYKGIDIGAKEDINRVIEELARNGGSVIVASTEFSDILDLVHRLFVMVNRKIVAELCGEQISSQKIIQHYQAVVR